MHYGLFTLPLALGAYLVHNSQELEGFSNCPHRGMFTSSVEQLHLSNKFIRLGTSALFATSCTTIPQYVLW
jgi:hypothetical protein